MNSKDGKKYPDRKGKNNPFYGKTHTKETMEKVIKANKGKKHSEETKEKIRKGNTGKVMSENSKEKLRKSISGEKHHNWKGGKARCLDCNVLLNNYKSKYCRRHCHTGERGPGWKGGITPLKHIIRENILYKKWRKKVFEKDDYTCQKCNIRSGNGKAVYLEAHHNNKTFSMIIKENKIKSIEDAVSCKELWNIENGLTLCKECHYNL